MKKIFILFLFTFLLAGCAQSNQVEVKTTGQQEINQTNQEKTMEKQRTLPDHQDLAANYKQAIIKTGLGEITVELYGDDSPMTVNNFLNLAQAGFYDNTLFHRVIKDFMIQGGDPNSRSDDKLSYGTGGPGYGFPDEINPHRLVRGSLAMANAGPNTNGSQFFVVTAESVPWLDGKHTNFGQVISGMDVVDAIEALETDQRDCPKEDAKIISIELIQ